MIWEASLIKRILTAICTMAYIGLALYPAYMLTLYMAEAVNYANLLVYAAGAAALAVLTGLLFGRRRLLPGLLLLMPALAGQYFLFPLPLLPAAALLAITAGYYLIALNRAPLDVVSGFSPKLTVMGIIIHVVVFIVSFFARYERLTASLAMPSALFLAATVLYINRMAVERSVLLHNRRAPRSVVTGNLAMTAAFAGIVLLVVNIGAVTAFIANAVKAITDSVSWLIALLMSLFEEEAVAEGALPPSSGDMMLPAAGGEPGLLAQILNIIFFVLGGAIAVALLCWVLYLMYKTALKIIARLRAIYARFRQSFATDYTDEHTSLMDGAGMLASMLDGARGALRRALARPPRWSAMDNAQRVRYALLRRRRALLRDGVDTSCLTPDQLLAKGYLNNGKADAAAFADAYNGVRYGGADATDEQADNARRLL